MGVISLVEERRRNLHLLSTCMCVSVAGITALPKKSEQGDLTLAKVDVHILHSQFVHP